MAVPSLTSELLSGKGVTPETEFNIKWAAASLYAGTFCPLHLMDETCHMLIDSISHSFVLSLVALGGADTVRLSHLASRVPECRYEHGVL